MVNTRTAFWSHVGSLPSPPLRLVITEQPDTILLRQLQSSGIDDTRKERNGLKVCIDVFEIEVSNAGKAQRFRPGLHIQYTRHNHLRGQTSSSAHPNVRQALHDYIVSTGRFQMVLFLPTPCDGSGASGLLEQTQESLPHSPSLGKPGQRAGQARNNGRRIIPGCGKIRCCP